ncbi:hypothetical protein D9757_009784 [Collybiopsis confluens]|uniref:Uncharacterized protein n=1 Tax=Collybiopsis confluens TaxID=2823264 RepID=A0A8H5HFR6_9AGAR|nr:hypothetical protein D9757_009784 [Collybiopsis confluens]
MSRSRKGIGPRARSSSPYIPSSPLHSLEISRQVTRRRLSASASPPNKKHKVDDEEDEHNNSGASSEDELHLRGFSQTGNRNLHKLYQLGLEESQVESYAYYKNIRAFQEYKNKEKLGKSSGSQTVKSDSDDQASTDTPLNQSHSGSDTSLGHNTEISRLLADNEALRDEVKTLTDIIQRTGDIFTGITQKGRNGQLNRPELIDVLNQYYIAQVLEE